jgi:hypothetical protein
MRSGYAGGESPDKFIHPERVVSTVGLDQDCVMPQSLAKMLVPAVFSTKDRRPFLRDPPLREELHRYLGGIPKLGKGAR